MIEIDPKYTTDFYFESHVTLEPLFGTNLEKAKEITETYGFHMADLVMKKSANETGTPNSEDSFCTGRSPIYKQLLDRTGLVCKKLTENGFKVYRYKIENTLLDTKVDNKCDIFNVIETKK